MKTWLLKILDNLPWDNWVTNRVKKSLERDRDFPLRYLFVKGINLLKSLFLSRFYLRKCDSVGEYPRTEKKPYIINNGKINIGDYVNITSRSVQCELVTYPSGEIEIGENVFINFGTTMVAESSITIGDNVKIGPYSMIHDTDFHVPGKDFIHSEGKPITIEDNAWINSRVLIMKGTVIGEGSVIAAGSVVSGIIPPNVVAGGVPAKIIKELDGQNNGQSTIVNGTKSSSKTPNMVKKVMAEALDVDVGKIDPKTAPPDVDGWTSHGHQALIEELETKFNINIDPNDRVRMRNFGKICRVLQDSYLNNETTISN